MDPDGNIELYKTNLNVYLDRLIDGFYNEAADKAKKSKAVKDGKKTEGEFSEEYVAKQASKLLQQINKKIKEDETTAGLSYIFGSSSETDGEKDKKDKDETKYRQVDVVLDDDKTTVMSSRVGKK